MFFKINYIKPKNKSVIELKGVKEFTFNALKLFNFLETWKISNLTLSTYIAL